MARPGRRGRAPCFPGVPSQASGSPRVYRGPVRDHRRSTGGSPGSCRTIRSNRPVRLNLSSEGFPPMVENATTSTVVSVPSGDLALKRRPLMSRRAGGLPPANRTLRIWPLWGAAIASTTRKTGVFVCLSGDMIAVCLEMGNFRPVPVHSPREEERLK